MFSKHLPTLAKEFKLTRSIAQENRRIFSFFFTQNTKGVKFSVNLLSQQCMTTSALSMCINTDQMIHYHMLRIPLKGGRGPLKTSKLVTFHALPAPDEEKERVITTRLPPSPPILLKLKSRLEAFLCNLTSVNESISLFYYFSFNEWADFIGRKRESFTTGAFWSLCKHSGKSSILEPNEDIQI